MRSLIKILLPPFVGFAIFFLMIRYSNEYFTLRIDEMGEGTVQSFMAFYRYLLPLLFVVAVLTQYVVVNPIWNRVSSKKAIIFAILITMVICTALAGAISYIIWDKTMGAKHMEKVALFMTAVQFMYWIIDFTILYLLDKGSKQIIVDAKTEE